MRRAAAYARVSSWNPPGVFSVSQTVAGLEDAGIVLRENTLDDQAVDEFIKRAEYEFYYPEYYHGRDAVKLKKIREHYMAATLLDLKPEDVYVDIASQFSPAPLIYERLFGCRVLRQDFEYVQGRNARVLGGSAGNMPLPTGSVTKMALHCSLEHFEGDEDVKLIRESARVLATGGKLAVVPLYLSDEYKVISQLDQWAMLPEENWPLFPPDAKVYGSRNSGNRHERYYDARHFIERLTVVPEMKLTLHSFESSPTARPGQMRFAALFERV